MTRSFLSRSRRSAKKRSPSSSTRFGPGWITTGPKTEKFTEAFREYVGGRHASALSSATAGLHLAVLAHGVGPGDEVITTPMTFAATLNVVELAGATPVLADIDRRNLNIRVEEIEKKITARTKAVIPVHYVGQPCDLDPILELARTASSRRDRRRGPRDREPNTAESGSARFRRRPSSRSIRTRTSRPAKGAWSSPTTRQSSRRCRC